MERFFRTVRQQFFAPLDATTIGSLKDLELRFHTWLDSEYHRSPHSGLEGRTPLEAWVQKAHLIIPLDPDVNLDEAFLHEAVRTVHKDSTVTLDGALFEVPSDLIGERISLRYDPHRPPRHRRLQILRGGQCIGEARLVDSYANTKVKRTDLAGQLEVSPPAPEDSSSGPPPRRAVDNSLSATHLSWDTTDQDDDDENAAGAEVVR